MAKETVLPPIRITHELKARLQSAAELNGYSGMSEYIRDLIERDLCDHTDDTGESTWVFDPTGSYTFSAGEVDDNTGNAGPARNVYRIHTFLRMTMDSLNQVTVTITLSITSASSDGNAEAIIIIPERHIRYISINQLSQTVADLLDTATDKYKENK